MLAQRAGNAQRDRARGSPTGLARLRPSASLTDAELVSAARGGDEGAFEQLYRRHREQVIAELLRVVRDPTVAEDLAQDVFIAALRGIRATTGPLSFRPWIREVARNAAIDSYRRSRRRTEVALEQVAEQDGHELGRASAATPAPPDVVLERKHSLRQLSGAFRGLDRVHHQILVLRELEGRSYDEIGERLKLSGPAVESTLYRARRRLSVEYRELLSGERCVRMRALLDASATGRLGLRDHRTLQRHVAWCSPCRSYAGVAGIAVPRTLPQRLGALLPLPGLAPLISWWLRVARRVREVGHRAGAVADGISRVPGGDPVSVAIVPLVGAAVALALGLGSDAGSQAQKLAHQRVAPSGGISAGLPAGIGGVGGTSSGATGRAGRAGGPGSGAGMGSGTGAVADPGAGGAGASTPGGGSTESGAGTPGGPSGSGGAGGGGSGVVSGVGGVVNGAVGAAGGVVSGAGGTVGGVVGAVGGAVGGAVSGAGGAVGGVVGAAGSTVDAAGGTVSSVTGAVGQAVQSTGSTIQSVGSTVSKLPMVGTTAGSATSTVGSTTSSAGSAVSSTGSGVASSGSGTVTGAVTTTTSTVSGAVTTTTSTASGSTSTLTSSASGLLSSSALGG